MGYINRSLSIAAGATVDNVLAGSVFEFAEEDGEVNVGILASATGLLASVSSGNDILLEENSPVNVVRIANQGPIYPDDFALEDAILAGERLRISVRNPTGGAITLFYAVKTTF